MKINYACGLLAVLLLSAWLMPFPAQAGPTALEWEALDKPGVTGNIVVSPSEVSDIAVGSSGVLYAIDSENSKVYRSLDAGVTWEDITSYLIDAGAVLPASKIAVAPDKPGIVAVVTNGDKGVYLSTDGGMTWTNTGVPSLRVDHIQTTIQAIAISNEYTQGSKSFWEIAIGTAYWGDNTTSGQVWVRQIGEAWTSWQNQYLTVDPSHRGGEVSALAYSPDFQNDYTLLVVASTSSDVGDDYKNKTWLCLHNTSGWNHLPGYPVKIADAGDVGVSYIHSSLALPSDYSSDEASSRQLFVSFDREPDAADDVYWLNDTAVTRLNADGSSAINIASIAYYGTTISGTLLAGDVSRVAGSLTVQVRRTTEPFDPSPTWNLATVPPTGPGNAKVSWSPDGEIAYCGTSKPPGVMLGEPDESAFSASLDGDKWRQMGLIDTVIRLGDIVLTPDSKSLLVTTYSPYGPEGIWRSAGEPLSRHWERLLTMDTTTDAVILRLSLNYSDDYTMYAAEVGGSQMAVSHNRGNSWQWCRATPGPVIDMAIGDEETIYVALPKGYVRKSTNGARTWRDAVETGLSSINMLAMVDKETILVGGKNGDVAYSADGGESFTRIREVIGSGSGDIQVIANTNYQENHTIYAATNLADEGIWRWVVGVSTQWEQIDRAITELGDGQCIGGLAIGPEGTLYALRIEQATSTSGGVTRSLNPSELDTTKVEFDLVNDALPAGAIFGPTPAFPNTLSCLKLSGNAKQNELWSIDGANQVIYRFQDTLCKLGPTPEMPKPGGIVPIDSSGYITNLTLGWEELVGATRYEAAIYLDSGATQGVWSGTSYGIEIIATDGSNPAQLLSGTTYYWRVRAIEPVKSPWSETRSFSPALGAAQWSPLATSTGISPPPDASNVPIRPAFAWNPADGATSYEFVLARDNQFTDVVVALTGADALSITTWGCDRDLDYSTTYFWKVIAISSTSYSNWGTSVFTTEAAPTAPLPPQSSPQSPVPEPTPTIPSYLMGVAIGIGAILFVALLVFIVRTRR
jgi:photosystem II stability/assembly factor-like uncharacterized protein